MWSYYGSKTKIAHLYPKPLHNSIIEPFAGAAKYSLLYFENDITLIDKDEKIIKIWHWLQQCSPNDILTLPILKKGETIKGLDFGCEGANLFMGFMVGRGLSRPQYKVSPFVASEKQYHFEFTYKRIANNLYKIKHWNIINGDYSIIENKKATWFFDPPYEFGGQNYRFNSKKIDFKQLAAYCFSRQGQIIICENSKATWLPFNDLVNIQGAINKSTESFYYIENSNQKTNSQFSIKL